MDRQGIPILQYINLIGDPMAALETRYDAKDGHMIPLIEAFQKNPIFGYGDSKLPGVFVGDIILNRFNWTYSHGFVFFPINV